METTRLSAKGQVVVPKRIRVAHNWPAGLEFTVVESEGGILLKPAALFPRTSLDEVAGPVGYHGKAKTLHEFNAGIARKARSGMIEVDADVDVRLNGWVVLTTARVERKRGSGHIFGFF